MEWRAAYAVCPNPYLKRSPWILSQLHPLMAFICKSKWLMPALAAISATAAISSTHSLSSAVISSFLIITSLPLIICIDMYFQFSLFFSISLFINEEEIEGLGDFSHFLPGEMCRREARSNKGSAGTLCWFLSGNQILLLLVPFASIIYFYAEVFLSQSTLYYIPFGIINAMFEITLISGVWYSFYALGCIC